MTTLTVFSGTGDGYIESYHPSYATARSGSGFLSNNTANPVFQVGQLDDGNSHIMEGFLVFDTSSLGSTATVSQVDLGIYGSTNLSTTDFTVEARAHGGSFAFVDGASLSALTRVATFDTTGFSTSGYNTFTEDGTNFRSNVSKTGTTYVLLDSSRTVSNSAPTGEERLEIYAADDAGTSRDPKLVVTYDLSTGRTHQMVV